jgi:two-component sensor histidine kinase
MVGPEFGFVPDEIETIGFQEFAPLPSSASDVRRFVRQVLDHRSVSADQLFQCELVADELATNSLRHAGSDFSVAVEMSGSVVRIAVRDDSGACPVERPNSTDAVGGRGVAIVSKTASEWGVVSLGLGKETWADISA